MEVKRFDAATRKSVDQLLASVPFYKMVKQNDPWQFEVLLSHSRIVDFEPGEVVLRSGEYDNWHYFLLKGQLAVFVSDDILDSAPINYITPGEVFGDLAMLLGNRQRTATLVADANCRKVVAFGTDFKVFGDVDDFKIITLPTKLAFYRNTVHNLRWKLEVYRMKYPDSDLAGLHHKVKLYVGPKDTIDELHSLNEQASALAKLLIQWNANFGVISLNDGGTINPELVAGVE